jgi:cytochrome c551/c552
MKKSSKIIFFLAVFFLMSLVGLLVLFLVDHDRHNERKWHHFLSYADDEEDDEDKGKRNKGALKGDAVFRPVNNLMYKTNCGGCHMAYLPELLPGPSWEKILNQAEDHFGEKITLEPKVREELLKYLRENAADRSSAKIAGKILASLEGKTPLRITEVPAFRKKHRKISPEIFNRKTIGSLSNCAACHPKAEQGNFDEDSVVIPQ